MIQLFVDQPELYNEWRLVWGGPWQRSTLVVLGLLLGVALYFSWRVSWRLSMQRRVVLFVLRLLGGALVLLLVAGPAIELRHVRKLKNDVPVLIDTSASMGLRNRPRQPTRMEKVRAFFDRNKEWLRWMQKEQKVSFYTFGREVSRWSDSLKKLRARGAQTNLLRVANLLQEQFQSRPLGGVVLVTDGVDTLSGPSRSASGVQREKGAKKKGKGGKKRRSSAAGLERRMRGVVALLKGLGVPVHVVAPGDDGVRRDLAVTRVFGDEFAFLHNSATLEVQIQVRGYKQGQITVTLQREGKLIQSQTLKIKPNQERYRLRFRFRPRQIGKYIYSFRVPVFAGETLTDNNQKRFLLKIIRDRIRVLQVAGRPSWDVRFLRELLKKNASVDLISFFILRTPRNAQNVPLRDIALIPFPTQELFTKSLKTFDLVIFQNFNYAPYYMRRFLPNIARFVRRGGAFLMIGGELSFGAGRYQNTEIEEILPVRIGQKTVDLRRFRPRLTAAGRRHPLTRLVTEPQQSRQIWRSFPRVAGVNLVEGLQPGAVVLLEHPFLKTEKEKPLPVLSLREVGRGRSMALTIDGSWRWNFLHVAHGKTREPYYRFWNNAVRWLIRDPELERLRVRMARSSFRRGERARFRIQLLDREYRPLKKGRVEAVIGRVPGGKIVFSAKRALDSEGTVTLEWVTGKAGMYRIRVRGFAPGEPTTTGEEVFEVRGVEEEFRRVTPNKAFFARLRQVTGGKTITLEQKIERLPFRPPKVVRIDRSQTVDLWDNLLFFFGMLLLFSLEWGFRRRWGLP